MKKVFQITTTIFILLLVFSFGLNASIVVLNGLTHENQIEPGETYRGTIKIQNAGANEKGVRVYVRDYWFSFTGENKHDPGGTLERSNADWITFNPELLTLDSSEIATIEYEVRVPDVDSLKGTYWSVLMVEGIAAPDTNNVEEGVKIRTAIRYAVQIITNVGSNGSSDLQFLGMELGKQEEVDMLYVAVENTGDCILKPEFTLELFNESGNSVGILRSEKKKTFPGTSILTSIQLEGIKPGNYNGVLIADCGEDRLYGTNLSIELE